MSPYNHVQDQIKKKNDALFKLQQVKKDGSLDSFRTPKTIDHTSSLTDLDIRS